MDIGRNARLPIWHHQPNLDGNRREAGAEKDSESARNVKK
jgi:hypothetical protein